MSTITNLPNVDKPWLFKKGNPGGPGNPYVQKQALLRKALIEAVGTDDMQDIIKSLIANAKAGDVMSAKEVFDRVIGKATQPLEITGKDGEPISTRSIDLTVLTVTELEMLLKLQQKIERSVE